VPIFENPIFTFDHNTARYLKTDFFEPNMFRMHSKKIKNLTISMFLNGNNNFKSLQIFNTEFSLNICENKYNTLKGLCRASINKFSKTVLAHKKNDTIQNFCMRRKKGSKHFRKIMLQNNCEEISSNILKFSDLIDLVINYDGSKKLNKQWNLKFFDNSTRTFLFKLHNNQLGLNTRVSHFVRNHSRDCTFCNLLRVNEQNDETTRHLFFECVATENFVSSIYKTVLNEGPLREISLREFFVGFEYSNHAKNKILDIINCLIKKNIWECKQRYHLPIIDNFKKILIAEIKKFSDLNSGFKKTLAASGLRLTADSVSF
jgi:hypothetical protein